MLTREDVVRHLTNEALEPLTILPWWREAWAALDRPDILEVLLRLVRQSGKSQFVSVESATTLLTVPGSYAVLVAASQQQQMAIYTRKLRRPLERLVRTLGLDDGSIRFTKTGVEVLELGSALEVVCSTDDTSPGRTISLLAVDEARYVADGTFTALAPSVIGAGGKMLIASSAGPPRGFFHKLCTNPTESTFVFESAENLNPRADRKVLSFLQRRLALIDPAAASRELDNQWTDDGEVLLPWALMEAAIDEDIEVVG